MRGVANHLLTLYYVNIVNKKDKRNSQNRARSHQKNCSRSLDSSKMKKALNFVSENSFENELLKRLDRMENKIKLSNTIKEEKHQSQEDKKQTSRSENDISSSIPADSESNSVQGDYESNSVQEDYQINQLLKKESVETVNRMSAQEFLSKQSEEKYESESEYEISTINSDQNQEKSVQGDKEINPEKAIKTSNSDIVWDKKKNSMRRNRFVRKMCNLKKFFSTRSQKS